MKYFTLLLITLSALAYAVEPRTYQEGVDTHVVSSCEPPVSREDGTVITQAELSQVELAFSPSATLFPKEHLQAGLNIHCNSTYLLSKLEFDTVYYKTARIQDTGGVWSRWSDKTDKASFVYLPIPPEPPPPEDPPTPGAPLVPRDNWTVLAVSSEELANWYMPATNAFDGNVDTLWHSQYQDGEPAHPHSIEIDMGKTYLVRGFRQLPRPDGGNGTVKDYEFYLSTDGKTWNIAYSGTFLAGFAEHEISFDPGIASRYFKFVALSEQDGGKSTSVAEINILGTEVELVPPNPPVID